MTNWIAFDDALAAVDDQASLQDAERHLISAIERGAIRCRGNEGADPSNILRNDIGIYPGSITTVDMEYDTKLEDALRPPPEKWEVNRTDLVAWISQIKNPSRKTWAHVPLTDLVNWYEKFLSDNPDANEMATSEAAYEHFGGKIGRDVIRELREKHRPVDHPSRKRGRKSRPI